LVVVGKAEGGSVLAASISSGASCNSSIEELSFS